MRTSGLDENPESVSASSSGPGLCEPRPSMDDVPHYPLGSVLNGSNSSFDDNEFASRSKWLKLAPRFYGVMRGQRSRTSYSGTL